MRTTARGRPRVEAVELAHHDGGARPSRPRRSGARRLGRRPPRRRDGPPCPRARAWPRRPRPAAPPPGAAATAAATAPSTSGASHSSTRSRYRLGQQVERRLGAEHRAPRSISTSTSPSAPARSMAAITRVASVPTPPVVHPARGLDRHLVAGHLARQLRHALGQPGAVGDEDDADHRGPPARTTGREAVGPVQDLHRVDRRGARGVPRSASGRSRSRTAASSALALADLPGTAGRRPAIAMSYFSRLSP